MPELPQELLARVGPAKALAMGVYGEDMAAYRYLLLAEKAQRAQDREEFRKMVAEEQQHRNRLQALLDKYFPGSDFVLSTQEKQMVESGSRTFKISDQASFESALCDVIASERLTSQFYGQMEPHIEEPEIRGIFRELAIEGVEHYKRLRQIAADNGISSTNT